MPVYDVGSTEDCPCFVVSKYIDGTDLATRLKQSRLSLARSGRTGGDGGRGAALRPQARAGASGHQAGQHPARHERQAVRGRFRAGLAGAGRGQGATLRRDARLHESRAGPWRRASGRWPQRHFQPGRGLLRIAVGTAAVSGPTRRTELLEQITSVEARPPRQMRRRHPEGTGTHLPEGPVEAGLGAVLDGQGHGRRPAALSGQHATAAEKHRCACSDCRRRLSPSSDAGGIDACSQPCRRRPRTASPSRSCRRACGPSMPTMPTSSSNCCPAHVTGTDLPDSIRFWKTRIEETDADNTFAVGLIYGPSGCGKSSLVKAGLLPRLSDDVIAVYVEATAEETETRLLNGLRKRCPALPDNLGLKETLAALRRGQGIPVGQESADRPRPVRAMAARQEGRREHRAGASPAAVRRRAGAVHRHGAG